jgi:ABC-type multidrug transport system permease subunit
MTTVLTSFTEEKAIVRRERSNLSYPLSAYFVGRLLAEIPMQILLAVFYGSIVYWSVNLNTKVDRFFIFIGLISLQTIASMAFGFTVSAAAPTIVEANALGPPIVVTFILFGGFYINSESLPLGSAWVQNLSTIYWTFQGLLLNEFRGESFRCGAIEPNGCTKTGDEVLMRLSFENGDLPTCIYALIAITVGFIAIAYVLLIWSGEAYIR